MSNPLLLPLVAALSAAAIELLRAFLLSLCNLFNFSLQELGLEEVIDMHDDLRQDPAFKRLTLQQRQASDVKHRRDGCRVPLPWTPSGSSMGFGPDGGCSCRNLSSGAVSVSLRRREAMILRLLLSPVQSPLGAAASRCSKESFVVWMRWGQHGHRRGGSVIGDDVDSVFFSPLVSVGWAISGVVSIDSAVLNGLKRLIPLDADSNVLGFERRHAAGRVVCVFNMVRFLAEVYHVLLKFVLCLRI